MRHLTELERIEAQALTDAYAKQLKTRKTMDGATDFADFAEFNKAAKAETALFDIKRFVARHSVADSIKQFVLKRNMEAQKKKEKAKENNNVSRPFWY
jgi:hypothetical protein